MGFAQFYPRYLAERSNRTCRRLHFVGTTLGLAAALHAFATLKFLMWKDMLTGKIAF